MVVLVELPTEGDRLDELLYVGLTRATTEPVVIAPPDSRVAWRDCGGRADQADRATGVRHQGRFAGISRPWA